MMRSLGKMGGALRLPLSAKILLWFFLNLVILAAGFILLFNAQFRFDLDWVFATSARQRVEAVRDLIVGELNTTTPDEWDRVLDRFGEAHHVHFALFEANGDNLIGSITNLPAEIRERMRPPQRSNSAAAQSPSIGGKSFVRTQHPTRYWLLLQAHLENPQAGNPMNVILLGEAESLSVGGLILDPAPWIILGVGAVIFSVLFWLPLLRGITRSVGQLTDTTRQIAEGRFDVRVSTRRRDELGSLAEAINQLAGRLNGFVQNQKRFLGDVAHELCSPLARLQMALGIIEQRADDSQRGYAKSAIEKAAQMGALVNELLAFSKASFEASAVQLQPVDLREAVEAAVRQEASDPVAEIQVEIPGNLLVLAKSELLVRAIANLLRNALRHGGNSGPVTISARKESGRVALSIADSGPGVPEDDLPRIFDAFYRVDTARTRETGGVGLGLTIVKTCMESCHGSVQARNRHPHGLEVILRVSELSRDF